MKTIIVKRILSFGDFIGRTFFYNHNQPYYINIHKDIVYSQIEPHANTLDIFSPQDLETDFPVLLFIHGGGWLSGNKKSYEKFCKLVASSGFVVVSMNYRLAPDNIFPSQVVDIFNCIHWLQSNLSSYHKNRKIESLFLAGDSAGGHLASLCAAIFTNPRLHAKYASFSPPEIKVSGLCLYYGVYNFDTVIFSGFHDIKTMVNSLFGSESPNSNPYYLYSSPEHFITSNYPSTFITVGEIDDLYNQTIDFIAQLKAQQIKVDALLFDASKKDAGHSFLHFYKRKSTQTAFIRMLKFITIEYEHQKKA